MKMDDGKEVVAKLPNPNAGRPHFTTASEVATMEYVSCSVSYLACLHQISHVCLDPRSARHSLSKGTRVELFK